MLKLTNSPAVREAFLQDIADLTLRYRSIDVYCPFLIPDIQGKYAVNLIHNNTCYTAYVEEYAKYASAEGRFTDIFSLKKDAVAHLGRLAAQYTNTGLVKTRSMWSILDLSPWDTIVDEKQENLDQLTGCLCRHGFDTLAGRLNLANEKARAVIGAYFEELPRCVYQGDLNPSNLLADNEGRFCGLIDFNMFGTEVNINCFLNECTWPLEEKDFEALTAGELLQNLLSTQEEFMSQILKNYALSTVEKQCLPAYREIILLSFYPNTVLWIYLLDHNLHAEKVCGLLQLIAESGLQL